MWWTSLDNVGLDPPFEDGFSDFNNYDSLAFGVLTGDVVSSTTVQDWAEGNSLIELLHVDILGPGEIMI